MADITQLILDDHDTFRREFAALDDTGETEQLCAIWEPLAALLDVHAAAEEAIFYPRLLRRGDDPEDETIDAIGDHNEIRDAIRAAAGADPGSDAWWAAVLACRKANDEHLAEEERDVIPDFREHSDQDQRDQLGVRWVAFHADHRGARGVSGDDIDPDEYVSENS